MFNKKKVKDLERIIEELEREIDSYVTLLSCAHGSELAYSNAMYSAYQLGYITFDQYYKIMGIYRMNLSSSKIEG